MNPWIMMNHAFSNRNGSWIGLANKENKFFPANLANMIFFSNRNEGLWAPHAKICILVQGHLGEQQNVAGKCHSSSLESVQQWAAWTYENSVFLSKRLNESKWYINIHWFTNTKRKGCLSSYGCIFHGFPANLAGKYWWYMKIWLVQNGPKSGIGQILA